MFCILDNTITTCCETKKLYEKGTGLTSWSGSNLGTCQNVKFHGDKNTMKYRIRAENQEKICPKGVSIKFGPGQDQSTTFEETFSCCQSNHKNYKLYSAKNTAIQPGTINMKIEVIVFLKVYFKKSSLH